MHIKRIIREEIDKHLGSEDYREIAANQALMLDLFAESLNEYDQELSRKVSEMIKTGQWEQPDPEEFYESLMKSRHKEMLTVYSPSELSDMKLFKLPGLSIGYALKTNDKKPYGEIVAVHNNEPDVKGIGEELMHSAVRNGGCYLDHFDSNKLSSLYSATGFEEVGRDAYDPKYDAEGAFSNKYGKLDVIYRKHRSC